MKKYDPKKIEKKWQKRWEDGKLHEARDDYSKKKYYPLVEFPYPSGDGLHVGHPRPYIALDIIARKRRAEGYNVLFPFGWDAFGLPTENYAIKTGIHPKEVTKKNTERFRKQVEMLGLSFDWSREINTTDPKYYKWTQWIFLELFKHGLAYKKKMPINWCLDCKVGLANEEVVDGRCERCGGETEKREKEQWMLAITKYADRLHDDLDTVDYEERIKIQQRNWIGRSDGAEISFRLVASQMNTDMHTDKRGYKIGEYQPPDPRISATLTSVKVFTTRPDTLFGATYLVLSPEHPWIEQEIRNPKSEILNKSEIQKYVNEAKRKSEIERTAEGKEKTGVELKGVKAINPANNEEIPIWIADYVLAHYGTGAIMAVPAHDDRDLQFALKFNFQVKPVIAQVNSVDESKTPGIAEGKLRSILESGFAHVGSGLLINSGKFNGLSNEEAKEKITAFVKGEKKITYKLRDWVFSRQRYWGEPIPLVFCENCKKRVGNSKSKKLNPKQSPNSKFQIPNSQFSEGELLNPGWVAVPEKELPVELPEIEEYKTSEDGESPLAHIQSFVNTTCPKCGGKARRETDTMPQWAGSSWYYLAYIMRGISNFQFPVSKYKKAFEKWLPVDWYNGGMEHTTLHLLYSRFWHKFLFDIGVVPTSEPYKKRTSHGLILAEGGEKMSKSKGNVINPDDIVEKVGADAFRLYEMFMGPFGEPIPWNTNNIAGVRRFLEKVWRLKEKRIKKKESPSTRAELGTGQARIEEKKLEVLLHRTIKKVSEDIESLKFNTAVSQLMILANEMEKQKAVSNYCYETLLRLLAPFAPHVTDELWEELGHTGSIHREPWPSYNEKKIQKKECTVAVQVDGKVRATITVSNDAEESAVKEQALNADGARKWIQEKQVKRIIFVKGRLVNIVTDTPSLEF